MHIHLVVAAILVALIGVVHSVLGELSIFQRLRGGSIVPSAALAPLNNRHLRILWATWHLASIFGWSMALILGYCSVIQEQPPFIIHSIAVSLLAAGALVLLATRARHPGWLGLIIAAASCWWPVMSG